MFLQTILILTVLCTLTPVSSAHQEMILIGQLNGFFHFDHNIFWIDTDVDINPFISRTELTPRSMYSLQANFGEWSVESKNTFVIVALASSKFNQTSRLRERLEILQDRQIKTKIGIFFPVFASMDDLQELFEWCKLNLIVDIFATIRFHQSLNIFTFDPFGPVTMVNLTSSAPDNFFTNKISKYKRLTVERFGGDHGSSILWPTSFDIEELYMEIRRSHMDLDSDPFENGINVIPAISYDCDTRVYPLAMLPQVIVVPLSLPYSDFTAYLLSFTSDKFFAYLLITVAVLMLLLTISRFIKQKKIRFFQSVTDVLSLVINDNTSISYQRLTLIECYLIVPLTFAGIVFANGILSILQSFLTRPVYEHQINSIEEIYRSKFPIFTWGSWEEVVESALQSQTNFENWNDTIVVIDEYDLANDIGLYNRIAFIASSTTARLLTDTQKRLNIRGYHNTHIPVGHLFLSYPIDNRFVFWERLNEIVLAIQCAGLYDQWERENFARFEMKIVKTNQQRLSTQSDGHNTDNSLGFPIFICYSWFASTIVFIVEITWNSRLYRMLRK